MLNLDLVRSHFPSLSTDVVYLDNPGGTQIVQQALQGMQQYLLHGNANTGGVFRASQQTENMVEETRAALADFLNAASPDEIVFGPNMTSLTFNISRSLARTLNSGDEVVVTRLDHDGNVAPWLLVAEERGCSVRWVDFSPEDGTLDMADLERQINQRTKIVAVGYASNAVGTVNDVKRVAELAHTVGALCFVDAVQYAPHKPIDVQELDCDFLVCSAYKFFGPHLGILYGKYDLLDSLTPYKVRPISNLPPGKFETGTKSFEAIASTLGVMEHFAWLGTTFGGEFAERYQPHFSGRRLQLKQALAVIEDYEIGLSKILLEDLNSQSGLRIYGITNFDRLYQRVPTFAITLDGWEPRALSEELASENISVRHGNYYALGVMERLGLEEHGGAVRIGLAHYTTAAELQKLSTALAKIAARVA